MANMYDQYLYKPTGKDQLGLGIGSLISAALASTGGNNTREALIRAAAGGLAGYGSGWKGMQDQYGDIFSRALADKRLQNQEQSMAIRNALGIENQGLRREQFEANKPLIKARTEKYGTDNVDYNKIRDERVKRRLDIRAKRADLSKPIYAPGEEGRASFENINNLSGLPPEQLATIRKTPEYVAALNAFIKPNITAEPYSPDLGGDAKTPTKGLWESIKNRFSTSPQSNIISKGTGEALGNRRATQPPQITIDQFLNEARKVNPGVSDNELTRFYNKKYGQ